jgi:dTMP kinase
MSFPNRSSPYTGTCIQSILQSKADQAVSIPIHPQASHLIFSANRWEQADKIVNHLHNSQHVVLDRYSYSGVAYSVALGLDREVCRRTEIGLPKPDVVFYLRAEFECLRMRAGYGQESTEREDIQRTVMKEFDDYAREDADRWTVLDASKPMSVVHEEVVERLNNVVSSEAIQYL